MTPTLYHGRYGVLLFINIYCLNRTVCYTYRTNILSMKLVILPGNSKKANEQWEQRSAATFAQNVPEKDIYQHRYEHWDSGAKIINFDAELERLMEALKDEKEYVIFGKSAGAMLAIYGVSQGKLTPKKCVFVGVPTKWAKEQQFPLEQWLETFDAPTTVIQQSEDPYATPAELQELLTQLKKENITLSEIPGNDHGYEDFAAFKENALTFLLKKEKETEPTKEETETEPGEHRKIR